MSSRLTTTAAAVLSAALVSIGLAPPAAAADAWQMPGPLRGATLAQAQAVLQPLLEAADQELHVSNVSGPAQQITNGNNWIVCWQSPQAGRKVTAKSWMGLGVRRPGTRC